jgi:hypothetical protein
MFKNIFVFTYNKISLEIYNFGMSITEVLLIVVVVVLLLYIYRNKSARKSGINKVFDCVDRRSGDITTVKMESSKSPESVHTNENAEYFAVCGDSTDIQKQLSCYCSDSTGQFANDEYGGPGLDFKDYVMAQGVDAQVVRNHADFVRERSQGGSVNWTGRTWAMPDEIETEFMPKAWEGIRGRPQAVPICNPTQVTDPTSRQFTKDQKLTWSSS